MFLTDQVSGMRRGVHARIGTLKSEGSKGGVQEGGVQEIRPDIVEYMGGCQNPNYKSLIPNTQIEWGLGCFLRSSVNIWVVVKIMVPFWIPIIIRHLIFRVPKKGP